MEVLVVLGFVITWLAIGYLWYRQRNMVSSEREGERVILKDQEGIIKRNIISE